MSDLVERLHERAESYRQSGPSAEHTAVMLEEAASRISQQDAELERLRREVEEAKRTSVGDWANQRENDHLTIKMYEWKARAEAAEAKLAEARKAAFIEAAEMVEARAAYWKGRKPIDNLAMTKEQMGEIFLEKRLALENIAAALRAKAEETGR